MTLGKKGERPPLESLGLGGDGDEIDAIEKIERRFGVILDKADAPRWRTVGDVFASLLQALPPERAAAASTWPEFCAAICEETAADPRRVESDTLLLGIGLRERLNRWIDRSLRRLGRH